MKAGKINLDQVVKTFSGEEVPQPGGELLTYKSVVLNMLGGMKPDSGEEAIHVSVLGTALYKETGEFEIDQQDFDLLKKAVEQNQPGYIAMVQGQVLGYLTKAVKTDG